jgi:hypothetical protein
MQGAVQDEGISTAQTITIATSDGVRMMCCAGGYAHS